MKEKKNKNSQRDQAKNPEKQNTPASSSRMHSGAVYGGTKKKKPYSHRTGDATSLGGRTYQED